MLHSCVCATFTYCVHAVMQGHSQALASVGTSLYEAYVARNFTSFISRRRVVPLFRFTSLGIMCIRNNLGEGSLEQCLG
jgi:hypothetical protein